MNRPAPANTPNSTPNTKRQFNVAAPIEKFDDRGKVINTFWQPIGRAFENEAKNGRPPSISIKLNALPLSDRLVLFEDDGQGGAEREVGTDDDKK